MPGSVALGASSVLVAAPTARAIELRQTEVENLHALVARDEDVLRLQVAMDDALLVRGREAVGDLNARSRRPSRTGSATAQPLAKRLAFEQLGRRCTGLRRRVPTS